jgi:hypothetical protein
MSSQSTISWAIRDTQVHFDRGEIDASGAERFRHRYYRDFADAGDGPHRHTSDAGFATSKNSPTPRAWKTFCPSSSAAAGAAADVPPVVEAQMFATVSRLIFWTPSMARPSAVLDITIPASTREGQVLRLRGKGRPSQRR